MGNQTFRSTQICGSRLETTVHSPFDLVTGMITFPKPPTNHLDFFTWSSLPPRCLAQSDISVPRFLQHAVRALRYLVVHAASIRFAGEFSYDDIAAA